MKRNLFKFVKYIVTFAFIFAMVIGIFSNEISADGDVRLVKRVGGRNRYETGVLLSQQTFTSTDNIVMVSGEKFPDALTSILYAYKNGAPILLNSSKKLEPSVEKEISRLGANNITLIGGKNALSSKIEKQLRGKNVVRISGGDRYETAFSLAKDSILPETKEVIIANGNNYPDALAAGPYSLKNSAPILLYSGKNGRDIRLFMTRNGISSAIVAGGKSAVDNGFVNLLEKSSIKVKRLGGKDRYETAKLLAKATYPESKNIILASGEKFADALAAANLSKTISAPIILTSKSSADASLRSYSKNLEYIKVFIIGGTSAIRTSKLENDKEWLKGPKNPENDPEKEPEIKPGDIVDTKPDYRPAHKPNNSLRKTRVFIDPGHGGKDPGAVANGLQEKDVNLSIALLFRDELEKRGYETMMSRETDQYVKLIDRAIMSNEWGPDIFVSLHHNSSNTTGKGLETWYYQYNKNYQPRINKKMHNNPERVAYSKELAKCIQRSISKESMMESRGIKSTSFLVCRESMVPAVLVELGFLTSAWDSKWIGDPTHQAILGKALADGIDNYFK